MDTYGYLEAGSMEALWYYINVRELYIVVNEAPKNPKVGLVEFVEPFASPWIKLQELKWCGCLFMGPEGRNTRTTNGDFQGWAC